MRKPGTKGAPTAKNFKQAAKTAKKPRKERIITMPMGPGTYGSKVGRPKKETNEQHETKEKWFNDEKET